MQYMTTYVPMEMYIDTFLCYTSSYVCIRILPTNALHVYVKIPHWFWRLESIQPVAYIFCGSCHVVLSLDSDAMLCMPCD